MACQGSARKSSRTVRPYSGVPVNLLESDFLIGANLPWASYGVDFGANAWCAEGGIGQPDRLSHLDATFERLSASGVRAVRWFLFCDGRAGIEFSASGRPMGLDAFIFRDIDAALSVAQRYGLRIIFVLLDFVMCDPVRIVKGVQLGGRSYLLQNPKARRALFDRVLRPVFNRYGREHAILAWDLINEPEWIRTLTSDQLYEYLSEAASVVRANASQPVTVGSAGARWRSFYQDLGLDFYQVHWYDSLGGQPALEKPVTELGFDRPVILGEFPTSGSQRTPSEILDTAHAAGYAGAFYWSALADDRSTDPAAAKLLSRSLVHGFTGALPF